MIKNRGRQKLLRNLCKTPKGIWQKFLKGETDIDILTLLTIMAANYYESSFDEYGQRKYYATDEQVAKKVKFFSSLIDPYKREGIHIKIRNVGKGIPHNQISFVSVLKELFCAHDNQDGQTCKRISTKQTSAIQKAKKEIKKKKTN